MNKFIGDKKFYKMVLAIAVPIMIQNGITNFVSLLDNIMVGQIGTEQMSGVAISNQLIFVFNLCIFGVISGAGIFGAQFYGQGNQQGVKEVLRFKIVIASIVTALSMLIFLMWGEPMINQFLHQSNSGENIAIALEHGKHYLWIMLIGLIPFAVVQTYASTLRETGETIVPMKAGIAAVLVNLVLNYLLIFGKFGMPKLEAGGAAIATVISRFVECFIIVHWTHTHTKRNPFIVGLYKHFTISRHLAKQIILKGTPLMLNETMWAAGITMLNRCYSQRGLSVIAALNIATTISNLFNVVFIALGSSIAIVVGQLLGAGKMKEAKETDTRMIFFCVSSCIFIGSLLGIMAPLFPRFYNTSGEVKHLAEKFILISALYMPIGAFMHAAYFTLRSGGKTIITFLFDSVYVWVVTVPLAFCLTKWTLLPIIVIYFSCQMIDLIKCVIGYILVKKGVWIHNIVLSEKVG